MSRRLAVAVIFALAVATVPARASQAPPELQALIDATPTGATLTLEAGTYAGGVVVDRSMTITGVDWPVIDGGGEGTVILVQAPDVTITGLHIRNTGISLDRENSGIEANAERVAIVGNRFEDVLFGIFLRQAPDSVVGGNTISGKQLDLGRRGDAIRLWESSRSEVSDNVVTDTRDIVLWFSDDLVVTGNLATGGRYGLHFMYSDDALVSRNQLTDNSVGAFLMYSRDLVLTDNVMARNNGPSGFGIGFKDVDGIEASGNRFIDNRVGVHLDNSPWSRDVWQTFDGNLFAYNDIGVAFLPAVRRNTFTGNAFIDNGDQVAVLGGGSFTGNEWSRDGVGNYWSDFAGYDADGDGIGDIPYRLADLYSTLTDNHRELELFSGTPAARALDVAAHIFPVLEPRPKVEDPAPLVRTPDFAPVDGVAPPGHQRHPPRDLGGVPGRGGAARRPRCPPRRLPTAEGGHVIEITGLTKRYGKVAVVDDFSTTVAGGESIALWGPNGAGKTTVVRCILGLVAYEGTIEVDGCDARRQGKAARSRLGYVAQELSFYDDLTVLETLDFSASLRSLAAERVDAVVELVGLADHARKRVRELSGGLKQRLGIAAALLPDPPILLLDEPTSNLDAAAREATVELLDSLRARQRSLVVTSHHLEEVGMLVDRVIAMEAGRITVECPPAELAERLGLRAWLHLVVPDGAIPRAVEVLRAGAFDAHQNAYGVLVEVSAQGKGRAIAALQEAGIAIEDLEVWR